MTSTVSVVLRSHDDQPLVAETLKSLRCQTVKHRLLAFDNASTDGTCEAVARCADRLISVAHGDYVPGRVLNQGMKLAGGDLVVFLNADCTPCDETWLETLLAGFDNEGVAAVFGRQIPRPGCQPHFARDIEDAFGDGGRQRAWRNRFSMAASAIRRTAWETWPFDESLSYSEDIDWTWRARQLGWQIRYAPDARALHSHNYSLTQWFRRQQGEGRAEAAIFPWSRWQRSLLRYSLLPFCSQVARDWKSQLPLGQVGSALYSPVLRLAQAYGRRRGFLAGRRQTRT